MTNDLLERPGQRNSDDSDDWIHSLKHAQDDESANEDDGDSPEEKSASPASIRSAESGGGGAKESSADKKESAAVDKLDDNDNDIPYREENGRFSKLRKRLGNDGLLGSMQKHKTSFGVGGAITVMLFLFFMSSLSSFKVIHFGEVLAATGYTRANGIFQERTTQNIFDASVIEGDGTVQLKGRTLVDRIKARNLDAQISELGNEGSLRFEFNDGKMTGVKVKGESINLDGITRELGHGESFSDIGSGISKFRPKNMKAVMEVRSEFTKRVQSSVGEAFAQESRALRGRVFSTIADNIGFDFSRWRQAGRDFIGDNASKAATKDAVNEASENNKATDIDNVSKETKDAMGEAKSKERLQNYLEKTGGEFVEKDFTTSYARDIAARTKVQETASNIGTFVLVASLACMANDAARNVDQIQKNNEISAEKTAADAMAARDQNKAGKVTPEAVSGLAKRYNGAEKSSSYQRLTGQPVTSDVPVANLKPDFNPNVLNIIKTVSSPTTLGLGPVAILGRALGAGEAIDSVDATFCSALLSPVGAGVAVGGEVVAQAVIGFLTDGGGTLATEGAAKEAASIFLKNLGSAAFKTGKDLFSPKSFATFGAMSLFSLGLTYVVGMLAGTNFSPAKSGPELFDNSQTGTNLLQSRRERTISYSRPVSTADAVSTDKHYGELSTQYRQSQSLFARYFSPSNPFSLVGLASAQIPSSGGGALEDAPSAFAHMASVLNPFSSTSLLRLPFLHSGVVHAADNIDKYGDIQQWSYSSDELNKMRNDPTYSISQNENFISQDTIDKKDDEIGKCFDPALTQAEVEKLPECSADNLGKDDNFRYRLYKFDSAIAESSEENLRPSADPTASLPAATPAASDPAASNSTACAAGSDTIPGTFDGYVGGTKKSLTLCAIQDLPVEAHDSDSAESIPGSAYYVPGANNRVLVSSTVSDKVVAMVKKAKSDGTPLKALSSFRTNDHQTKACGKVTNGKCANAGYAPPGQSAHQSGEAIDFKDSNMNSTANCKSHTINGRCMGTDAIWLWLSKNAESFGFKQLPSESWHWSTSGT